MFIWTVNRCQTHTKSTLLRALTWSHPSSPAGGSGRVAKYHRPPGLVLGWWGRKKASCKKAKAMGDGEPFPPVQRRGGAPRQDGAISSRKLDNRLAPRLSLLAEFIHKAHLGGPPGLLWPGGLEGPQMPQLGQIHRAWSHLRGPHGAPGANNSSMVCGSQVQMAVPIRYLTGSSPCLPGRSCFLKFRAIFNRTFKNCFCNSFTCFTT